MFCNWETSCEWRRHIEGVGLTVVSQVIWDREHHGMGDLAGGFAPMHDVVWYATKGRRVFAGERPKSVLRHRRPSPGADFGHPTCKPLSLMREIVDAIKRDTHLPTIDPFMGSGTTGAACVMTGVHFLGTEIDATYFDIAARRISAAAKGVVSNSLPGQQTLWDAVSA
jgi:site-specific DNA-methyltransferase (adenine-specific)